MEYFPSIEYLLFSVDILTMIYTSKYTAEMYGHPTMFANVSGHTVLFYNIVCWFLTMFYFLV